MRRRSKRFAHFRTLSLVMCRSAATRPMLRLSASARMMRARPAFSDRHGLGPDESFEFGTLRGGETDLDRADEGHPHRLPERWFQGQQTGDEFARSGTEGIGPRCHVRAVLSLIEAAAAAASIVLFSIRFFLSKRTCLSLTIGGSSSPDAWSELSAPHRRTSRPHGRPTGRSSCRQAAEVVVADHRRINPANAGTSARGPPRLRTSRTYARRATRPMARSDLGARHRRSLPPTVGSTLLTQGHQPAAPEAESFSCLRGTRHARPMDRRGSRCQTCQAPQIPPQPSDQPCQRRDTSPRSQG